MARSNTPNRILGTSLALFNQYGEPNITTNRIADELDISPGNLHYHFPRKQDIVFALFGSFQQALQAVLVEIDDRQLELEDMWWYLHLVFETIGEHRFIYRDLNDILARYDRLKRPFGLLLGRKRSSVRSVCTALKRAGILKIESPDLDTLVDHFVMTITFWIPFSAIDPKSQAPGEDALARAIYQVISLAIPYLREPERSLARNLALQYVL